MKTLAKINNSQTHFSNPLESESSMEDSDHQPTHSGALIGSNDDLLTEILLWLPVTSILRFKSISKHWRLLLRHRHFTHREWRICPVTFRTDCPDFEMGVYWNGAIHWPPSYRNHLYFKIDAEQLQTLPSLVEMTIFQTLTMYFGESRGHLHLTVLVDSDETGSHLNVYEMLGDHSGWLVKYQLQLHELWGAFPEMTHSSLDFDVVDVVRGVKEEDTFVVLRIHGKLTRYNVHGKSFKQMCYFTDQASRKYAIAHRYTEYLSSF
ncbi:putative F-box domain-containing protein [Helianthus annuus]|nr:putative F-box domain-containing protein [Helianthus annuus]